MLTFRGYTGESVKTRAEAWGDAGDPELGKEILKRRRALVKRLTVLENGVYAAQTNNKAKMLSSSELSDALSGSLVALDAVIDKMGYSRLMGR